MRMRSRVTRLGIVVLVFALAGSMVSADPGDRTTDRVVVSDDVAEGVTALSTEPEDMGFQWMIKFVCGFVPTSGDALEPVVPGRYGTAINVAGDHTGHTMSFRRVRLHYTPGSPRPPRLTSRKAWVFRDTVLEIDCTDIWSMAGVSPGTFLKGVVHLGLIQRLPVIAVYTSQTNNSGPDSLPNAAAGVSIDVEYIEPFTVPAS